MREDQTMKVPFSALLLTLATACGSTPEAHRSTNFNANLAPVNGSGAPVSLRLGACRFRCPQVGAAQFTGEGRTGQPEQTDAEGYVSFDPPPGTTCDDVVVTQVGTGGRCQ